MYVSWESWPVTITGLHFHKFRLVYGGIRQTTTADSSRQRFWREFRANAPRHWHCSPTYRLVRSNRSRAWRHHRRGRGASEVNTFGQARIAPRWCPIRYTSLYFPRCNVIGQYRVSPADPVCGRSEWMGQIVKIETMLCLREFVVLCKKRKNTTAKR